jgi:hypothetical protein
MANLTVTNCEFSPVVVSNPVYRDELLTLAGADVIAAGTILARSTATLKLVLYVKGGSTAGNGVACAVLPYAVTSTGAGDTPVRALVSGEVSKTALVIDADGTDANIDGTVVDLLRARGITPLVVTNTSVLDNQ